MHQDQKIRLCTLHSSRRLEAARVLIYGIERIEDLAGKVDADFRKLGFIILSRAKADTVVIRRAFDDQAAPFVEKSIVAVHNAPARRGSLLSHDALLLTVEGICWLSHSSSKPSFTGSCASWLAEEKLAYWRHPRKRSQ